MADNKKYYYLKVKETFYESEEMIILQSMPDGYIYSDILMKLYLRSLKSEGKLIFKGVIPYTPEILATVVRHQVGTVEKALEVFENLGLIDVLDNGAIYMLDIQNFIGKSSTEADRQREYQNRIKLEKKQCELQACKNSNKKPTPEKEIETEKDIEKEIESIHTNTDEPCGSLPLPFSELHETEAEEEETATPKKAAQIRHKYGEYKNVLLSDDEFEKLKNEFPGDWSERIENLSEYIASTGKKYKNFLATIRKWSKNERKEVQPNAKTDDADEEYRRALERRVRSTGTWL